VVKTLSRFLEPLIAKFAGPQLSKPLSQAIVDAGLRLISLEVTPETEARVAGSALAATVEETVRQVAELDEAVLDSEPLLEAAVAEAFEQAAAANFPPVLLRPQLRPTSAAGGTWVSLPLRGRPCYKRYTQVLTATVTPQLARLVPTFGGGTLHGVLRDQYGVSGPVDLRLRLYEALPGTWLGRVGAADRDTPAGTPSWRQLYPLTPQAAALLLREPGLGREVPESYLAGPDTVAQGQRFYHFEVVGGAVAAATTRAGGRPRRTTRLTVAIHPARGEARVRLYLAESEAQAIGTQLARGAAGTRTVTRLLAGRIRSEVLAVFSGRGRRRVRIVHEAVPEDHLLGSAVNRLSAPLRTWLAQCVLTWVHAALTERFAERHGRAFSAALADPADGVTIVVTIKGAAPLRTLGGALKGGVAGLADAIMPKAGDRPPAADISVEISPGFRR
jgi:hypothetical protein